MARLQRRFLLGSRWTARRPLPGSAGECHFEVVGVQREAAGEVCELRAVLTGARYRLELRAFEDRDRWLTGWQSLPPGEERVAPAAPPGALVDES